MSEIRAIRRSTRNLIQEQMRAQAEEVERLRSIYAQNEEDLRKKLQSQEEDYKQKLAEKNQEMQRAIDRGQQELARKAQALAEDLSRRLTELQEETRNAIRQQQEELENKINKIFRAVEAKIKDLYQTIEDKETREETYARECIEHARGRLDELKKDKAVQMFNLEFVNCLIDQFNAVISLGENRLWINMALGAVNVEIQGDAAKLEAQELYEQWLRKKEALSGSLQTLLERIQTAGEGEAEFSLGLVGYRTARKRWAEDLFSQTENSIRKMLERLSSEPPCTMEEMFQMELELPQLDDQVENAIRTAEGQINVYLMVADAVYAIQEVLEDDGWQTSDDGIDIQEIQNTGEMLLLSDEDLLDVRISGNPANPGEIRVVLSYAGPATQVMRQRQLRSICGFLAEALTSPGYGGLSVGTVNYFRDGERECAAFPLFSSAGAFRIQDTEADKTDGDEAPSQPAVHPAKQEEKKPETIQEA